MVTVFYELVPILFHKQAVEKLLQKRDASNDASNDPFLLGLAHHAVKGVLSVASKAGSLIGHIIGDTEFHPRSIQEDYAALAKSEMKTFQDELNEFQKSAMVSSKFTFSLPVLL